MKGYELMPVRERGGVSGRQYFGPLKSGMPLESKTMHTQTAAEVRTKVEKLQEEVSNIM